MPSNVPSMLLPLKMQALAHEKSRAGGTFIGTGSSTLNFHKSTNPDLLPIEESMNPWGTFGEQTRFFGAEPKEQQLVLLNMLRNAKNFGSQNAVDAVIAMWDKQDKATNGWTTKELVSQSGKDIVQAFNNISGKGSGLPKGFRGAEEFNINQIGFGSFKGHEKNLPTRELIRRAYHVDIGNVANSLSMTDAVKIAALELSLGSSGNNTFLSSSALRNSGGIASGLNLGLGNFAGISATAAFQVNSVNVPLWVRDQIRDRDRFANSGKAQAVQKAGQIFDSNKSVGMLSRSASKQFKLKFSPIFSYSGTTFKHAPVFGSDEIAENQAELLRADLNSADFPNMSNVMKFVHGMIGIADDRIDRVEHAISSGIGIDFNANDKSGYRFRVPRAGGGGGWSFRNTAMPVNKQIRLDIGASAGIIIPSIGKLEALTQAFNTNGNFTNFNNIAIEGQAHTQLHITEQKIFDIRFNSTRGDRELLNRLRFVERNEAGSSGTSPL